jgi:hypothetical protein
MFGGRLSRCCGGRAGSTHCVNFVLSVACRTAGYGRRDRLQPTRSRSSGPKIERREADIHVVEPRPSNRRTSKFAANPEILIAPRFRKRTSNVLTSAPPACHLCRTLRRHDACVGLASRPRKGMALLSIRSLLLCHRARLFFARPGSALRRWTDRRWRTGHWTRLPRQHAAAWPANHGKAERHIRFQRDPVPCRLRFPSDQIPPYYEVWPRLHQNR